MWFGMRNLVVSGCQYPAALRSRLCSTAAPVVVTQHELSLGLKAVSTPLKPGCAPHSLQATSRSCRLAVSVTVSGRTVETSTRQPLTRPRVLFVSPVWPERGSSAAGVRTADLIEAFKDWKWDVSYFSSAAKNAYTQALQEAGVPTFSCLPNREADFCAVLREVDPTICVFDRFYAEEAFSFRVRQHAPAALRVLDMQDVHFLRRGRAALAKQGASIQDIVTFRPDAVAPDVHRELASILRSDLTLVCSPMELRMLPEVYQVPPEKLCLASFFGPPPPDLAPGFAERRHYMTIGNFRHEPNMDSVKWLVGELWEAIRCRLEPNCDAELHVYGAYPEAARHMHAPARGIHLKGHAPSLGVMRQYKVCLAPLRFGAGLKGKVVDSWAHGLPVVTTPIGSEGLTWADRPTQGKAEQSGTEVGRAWGGLHHAGDADSFADAAAQLYQDELLWRQCQAAGFELLGEMFDKQQNLQVIKAEIEETASGLVNVRARDFLGQMLWAQQLRATEYFSRWIELKESIQTARQEGAIGEMPLR